MATRLSFRDTNAILRRGDVGLESVAGFLSDVRDLGLYLEPKDYSARARPLVKAMDARIVELARNAALFRSDRHKADLVLDVAAIRDDLDGHFWRAERIMARAA